jgi:hypothetical protein
MKLSELKTSVDNMYKCVEGTEDPDIIIQAGQNPFMTLTLDEVKLIKAIYCTTPKPVSQVIMNLRVSLSI